MKWMTTQKFSIAFFGILPVVIFTTATGATLDVKVMGFQNNAGVARIAVFNSAQSYKNDDTTGAMAFRKCATKIHHLTAECHFTLPPGNYAVKTYHDIDNSNKLKVGSFGIPQESYGFSNNPNNDSGSRSWPNALFSVNKSKVLQKIELINK